MRQGKAFFYFIFFSSLAFSAVAQTTEKFYDPAGRMNSIEHVGQSPRTSVLGPGFAGVADDASALFLNPAGLGFLKRGEISFNSYFGTLVAAQGTAVLGLPLENWGGLGLAGSYLSYGAMEGRDAAGSLLPDYGADRMGFQGGLGIQLLKELSVGISLGFSRQGMDGTAYSYFTPGAGLLLKPSKTWKIGLDYRYAFGDFPSNPAVSTLKAGSSWEIPLDSSTRLLGVLGCSLQSNSYHLLQAGAEAVYKEKYFLRAGYQVPLQDNGNGGFAGLSVGAGLTLAGLTLDYAFLLGGDLGNTHRFGVTFPFQGQAKVTGGSSNAGSQAGQDGKKDDLGLKPGSANGTSKTGSSNPLMGKSPAGTSLTGKPPEAGVGNSSATTVYYPGPPGISPLAQPKPEKEDAPKDSLTLQFDIPPDFVAKGAQLESQGLANDAAASYRKAIQQDPRNVQAWWSLGSLYARQGQKAPAIQCLETALKLRPDNKVLRDWLEKYKGQ